MAKQLRTRKAMQDIKTNQWGSTELNGFYVLVGKERKRCYLQDANYPVDVRQIPQGSIVIEFNPVKRVKGYPIAQLPFEPEPFIVDHAGYPQQKSFFGIKF